MSDPHKLQNKIKKLSGELNRRQFCKTASCAAFGLLSPLGIKELSCGTRTGFPVRGKMSGRKELTMAKPVKMIEAKVISQKGTCALGHKVGDVVRFTETGVEGKICIHALYSMLPAVFAMLHEAHFPWLKDPDVKTHACPDAYNPLVFEITRIRES
ncbi:TIGR04076 family protein [Acidobacteriota bacterium]